MKIETFIKGSVVVVVMFILGLTLLGEGILQQKYSVTDPPTFGNVTNYQDDLTGLQTNLEEETLARSEDPGQMDRDEDTTDVSWYTYTRRSLKAVEFAIQGPDSSRGAISEVLSYLHVNSMIIGGILTVIVLSFVFALVAWWKNRRV